MHLNTLDILVVDDHYANRLLAKTLLVRQGHEVTLANNGQACLDICEIKTFDLIILDIQMPIMDGLSALKCLRQKNTQCPIFALTAYCEPKDVRAYLGAGFNKVLTKPLKQNDIQLAWSAHQTQFTQPQERHHDVDIPAVQKPLIDLSHRSMAEIDIIDTEIIDPLYHAMSLTERKTLLKVFWYEVETTLAQMRAQAQSLDSADNDRLSQFRKNAHSLKGTSINVGALRTSRLSAQLQNSPVEQIPDLLEALQYTLELTRSALYEHFKIEPHADTTNIKPLTLPTTAAR